MIVIEKGEQILDKIDGHKYTVIWGTGVYGRKFYKEIFSFERKDRIYFCDNNGEGRMPCPQLITTNELQERIMSGQDILSVVCVKSDKAVNEIYGQLSAMGMPEEKVYRYRANMTSVSMREEVRANKSKGYYNGDKWVSPLDDSEAVRCIEDKIEKGEPFLFSRWGRVEARTILDYVMGFPGKADCSLMDNAGVFPLNMDTIRLFCEETLSAAKEIDILCAWFHNFDGEDKLFRWYSPKAAVVGSTVYYPFFSESAWTRKLRNKRVLVIHPFAGLIEKQYMKRELLWDNHDEILPLFDLITYKAVQSIGGNNAYVSWAEALNIMKHDIEKLEFDIALIGCGAYGMPLGGFIKNKMHRQAMHIGGTLQILFGIKGLRWEGEPYNYDTKLYNEFWVRPGEALKPKNYMNVEGGCYW